MIQNERDCRHEHVLGVARQMMTAARTAPKGKGVDVIEAALVTGEDLKKLSEKMNAMAEELGMKFFLRDAANVLQAECEFFNRSGVTGSINFCGNVWRIFADPDQNASKFVCLRARR